MKLSEKFARQESEAMRLARIARRRLSADRAQSIRNFLGLKDATPDDHRRAAPDDRRPRVVDGPHVCDTCGRRFVLPMHLGRHLKASHAPA
jgi:hypothetical protein